MGEIRDIFQQRAERIAQEADSARIRARNESDAMFATLESVFKPLLEGPTRHLFACVDCGLADGRTTAGGLYCHDCQQDRANERTTERI